MKHCILTAVCICTLLVMACTGKAPSANGGQENYTPEQQKLLSCGWQQVEPAGGDMDEKYGVKPVLGIQDNYFDIHIGKGFSAAIKIVSAETGRPVRYVYVPEGETITVNQIPQGLYYLKLAYGKDWMQQDGDSIVRGKFSKHAFYERSLLLYDFGRKNSQSFVNYTLEINVVNGEAEHEFKTVAISEEEFENNG